jgi:hypothetical protein
MEILNLICNNTKYMINTEWKDDLGNNILSYTAGIVSGFSHCNIMVMERVFGQISLDTFRKLLRLKNAQGN